MNKKKVFFLPIPQSEEIRQAFTKSSQFNKALCPRELANVEGYERSQVSWLKGLEVTSVLRSSIGLLED